MPVGQLNEGMLFNNALAANPELSHQGVIANGGQAAVFLPGTPAPKPQLLVGRTLNVEN